MGTEEVTTEVLTPATETVTVPEHAHPPHTHDEYVTAEHGHFDLIEPISSRLSELSDRVDALTARLDTPPVEEAVQPEPVPDTPQPKPKQRGIRQYVGSYKMNRRKR